MKNFASKVIFSLLMLMLPAGYVIAGNCKALVVVGMEDERKAAEGDDVQVVVGTAKATVLRERLQAVDVSQINAVFSFGVAGGLDPTLKPGDLLVSTQVIAQRLGNASLSEESWMSDQNILMAINLRVAKSGAVKIRKGIFLGTDMEARDNPHTATGDLRKLTGADIVDNESHIAAKFASEHNLPFVSVRAVSDSVNNTLPPAALISLDPNDGSPNMSAILWSVIKNPVQIPALIRTAREYGMALDSMHNFREKIGFSGLASCH